MLRFSVQMAFAAVSSRRAFDLVEEILGRAEAPEVGHEVVGS